MKTGTQFQCEIEKTALGGDALTHADGEVIFIPGALPGEKIIAEITAECRNFSRARIVRFGSTSPHRVTPECSCYPRCVNCRYLHCTYECENTLKQEQFRDLAVNAGVALPPEGIDFFAPVRSLHYRNKMVLHCRCIGKERQIGYVKEDNESVTDVSRCLLAKDALNEKLAECRSDASFLHTLHDHMDVTFREASGIVSVWRNQPPRNATWLREKVPFGTLSVPAGSFFQIHEEGCAYLVNRVCRLIREKGFDEVTDLYCGAGLFAAAAASCGVRKLTLVECDGQAVEAARYNLAQMGIHDAACITADAEKWLVKNARFSEKSLLITDPPRAGITLKAMNAITGSACRNLVSISCNPATWTRDALRLQKKGFRAAAVTVVNMFPRTAHFEIFSVFER